MVLMINTGQIPAHSESVVTRKTGDEYILVPVAENIADMDSIYTLNGTGAFIWEQIDGVKSVEELIVLVTGEFDIDRETAQNDVIDFIREMKKLKVLTVTAG